MANAIMEDNARMWKQRLREYCALFDTQKEAAESLNISAQYLSDLLLGNRAPGTDVLEILGLERVVIYRKKKA